MQNNGTKQLLLKLLILKNKIIESNLPEEERILIGIGIIEQFIKIHNPKDLSISEIDELLNFINNTIYNSIDTLSFSEKKGLDMALNTINKTKIKK